MTPIVAPETPRRGRRTAMLIACGVAVAVALAGVGVYVAFDGDSNERADGPTPSTAAVPATFAVDLSTGADDPVQPAADVPAQTLPLPAISLPLPGAPSPVTTAPATTTPLPAAQLPGDLGDDTVLDGLAGECYAGDMVACDDLYFAADFGTAYLTYGDTCAGRQPEHTTVPCVDAFATATPATIG